MFGLLTFASGAGVPGTGARVGLPGADMAGTAEPPPVPPGPPAAPHTAARLMTSMEDKVIIFIVASYFYGGVMGAVLLFPLFGGFIPLGTAVPLLGTAVPFGMVVPLGVVAPFGDNVFVPFRRLLCR